MFSPSSTSSFGKRKEGEREEKQGENGKEKGPCSNEQGPNLLLYFSIFRARARINLFCPEEEIEVASKYSDLVEVL